VAKVKHESKLLASVALNSQLYVVKASKGKIKLLPKLELSQKVKLSFSQIGSVEKSMSGIGWISIVDTVSESIQLFESETIIIASTIAPSNSLIF